MAKINFTDCRYFIYGHYNSIHDVNDIDIRNTVKKRNYPFKRQEYGFITGCRDSLELEYLVRHLDSSKDVDYVILEQMELFDL